MNVRKVRKIRLKSAQAHSEAPIKATIRLVSGVHYVAEISVVSPSGSVCTLLAHGMERKQAVTKAVKQFRRYAERGYRLRNCSK